MAAGTRPRVGSGRIGGSIEGSQHRLRFDAAVLFMDGGTNEGGAGRRHHWWRCSEQHVEGDGEVTSGARAVRPARSHRLPDTGASYLDGGPVVQPFASGQ